MTKIRLHLKGRSYDILIGAGLLEKTGALLGRLHIGSDAVVITNSRIRRLYGRKLERSLKGSAFTVRFELVPDSEKAKSSAVALRLISRIAAYDDRRSIFIIAFGGGVVGDLAGFVAATYKRGIPYIQLPTTLLAQVDSALGGKTAIDLSIAKNLVGAFWQPKMVISDISLVETLTARQIRSGLAEVIKYGVIKDARLFEFLEKNCPRILSGDRKALEYAVKRSSAIKAKVVEADEFDKTGARAILNLGHTIGHAVEAASSYSRDYNHGESVAIGIVAAADIALKLGRLRREDAMRIKELIGKVGLPTKIKGLKTARIYGPLAHDKKFARGKNAFVLPVSIGRSIVVRGVPDAVIRETLRSLS